jgi:mRNA interferase MazF
MNQMQWSLVEVNLDPASGAEQKGTRPVLLISNEEFNQAMPNVTILPLSSTRRRLYPSEVLLPAGRAGQPLESIIMAHQIRTISKKRLGKIIGRLDDKEIQYSVRQAIKEHLGLD